MLGVHASHPTLKQDLRQLSLDELERRATAIREELDQLAHDNLRTGVGSIGYRSEHHPAPRHNEWFQIELQGPTRIDEIVLVPAIWRDKKAGVGADGFPVAFRILAGTGATTNGIELARFTKDDALLPRIAPLVIPCAATASWVRVEASELSPRLFDGYFNLELSEIFVFSGEENVALQRPVRIPREDFVEKGARKREYLVDGFTPYLMDAGRGPQHISFLSISENHARPTLTMDLGVPFPVNRLHLHPIDLSDTVPQTTPSGFGVPYHFTIEGARTADFTDAVLLTEYQRNSIYETGPVIMRRFEETACRYIRLTVLDPYVFSEDENEHTRMGFAEFEVFSNGDNVALHASVTGKDLDTPQRHFSSLTDGSNFYGQILPIRQWMQELARRHDLENEGPRVAKELQRRYAFQKIQLRRLLWLASVLATGIAFILLVERMRRLRQAQRMKERFAADLHDELGANLHTIGLLSDLSKEVMDSPDQLEDVLDRIRLFTERSGTAARYCTNMLEAEGLCEDLAKEMKRSASRLLSDLDYELVFQGEEHLHTLSPRKRIDLFLFSKECLSNILRHSGASSVSIALSATDKRVKLTIIDDGTGLHGSNAVPSSLKRRARLLGGRVTATTPSRGNGTEINLDLNVRNFGLRL